MEVLAINASASIFLLAVSQLILLPLVKYSRIHPLNSCADNSHAYTHWDIINPDTLEVPIHLCLLTFDKAQGQHCMRARSTENISMGYMARKMRSFSVV